MVSNGDSKMLSEEIASYEMQELEIDDSISAEQLEKFYEEFLFRYLLANDLVSAKFLWKRIPESLKTKTSHIQLLWTLGQFMWHNNNELFYSYSENLMKDNSINQDIKGLVQRLVDEYRQRNVKKIKSVYSSIKIDDVSNQLGISVDDLQAFLTNMNWDKLEDNYYKPSEVQKQDCKRIDNNEIILKLTQLTTFIENH